MDRLPDVSNGFVMAGFSGHGFKFAPLLGQAMAQLMVGGKSDLNLHRFRLNGSDPMHSVSVGAAFLAGLASFLSPCVLPLVPGYISFMSGLSLEELSSGQPAPGTMRRAAWAALFFVLGFSAVFTALGASASFIGRLLAEHLPLLSKVAGVLVIVFGLHITGLVPIKWLYYTKRADTSKVAPGCWALS